jgi:hypothetical protein
MIFLKNVTFPYPIFAPFSDDYFKGTFEFNVEDVIDDEDKYKIEIRYELEHPFFVKLLQKNFAKLYFVIDNVTYFYFEVKSNFFNISKSRVALNKRTRFQLMIVTQSPISYKQNNYLDHEFRENQDEIIIQANQTIALSNVITYDGELKKPYDLFMFRVDPNLRQEIKIDISNEIITIIYSDPKFKYDGFTKAKHLNNHYVYLGLTQALFRMLNQYGGENQEIIISDQETFSEELNKKLLSLLKIYKVEVVNQENLDEVIHAISDKVILKHYNAIKELNRNED